MNFLDKFACTLHKTVSKKFPPETETDTSFLFFFGRGEGRSWKIKKPFSEDEHLKQ